MTVQVQRSFIRQYGVEDYNKTNPWFATPFVFWKQNLQENHELLKLLLRSIFRVLAQKVHLTDVLYSLPKGIKNDIALKSLYFCAYVLQVLHEIKLLTKQKVGICCYNFLPKINKIYQIFKMLSTQNKLWDSLFHCMQSLMKLFIDFTIKCIQ